MRRLLLLPAAGLVLLVACNKNKPSDATFTAAINQYLAQHGKVCISFDEQFPIDVPRSAPTDETSTAAKMAALQQANLVRETDTIAVVHGMLDALRGPTPPQPVRRYDLTAEGRRDLQQVPGTFGETPGFCYGQKTVASIIRWTTPQMSSPTQAEATYTYRIVNLAEWAQRTDVQQAFPDVKTTLQGASKVNRVVGLQLTNKGWLVP